MQVWVRIHLESGMNLNILATVKRNHFLGKKYTVFIGSETSATYSSEISFSFKEPNSIDLFGPNGRDSIWLTLVDNLERPAFDVSIGKKPVTTPIGRLSVLGNSVKPHLRISSASSADQFEIKESSAFLSIVRSYGPIKMFMPNSYSITNSKNEVVGRVREIYSVVLGCSVSVFIDSARIRDIERPLLVAAAVYISVNPSL